ncbi:MAG: ZIP family metal transporter [Clostridia bacterium]|nr:ZIP family metal transporter [Clostridia bacterium]
MNIEVIRGVLLPFAGTALGAAGVFFMRKEISSRLHRALSGAAAGIMAAASFFSLLLPSLEQGGLFPASVGFLLGLLFLPALDGLPVQTARTLTRQEKMMLAVTIHNLPEGMAVGVAYAGWLYGSGISFTGAFALALGIALQNFPEGAIVAMPLRAEGKSRSQAFLWGVLSGAVEPVGAALILLAAGIFLPVLPYLLSFAAGAMFCVILEELTPDIIGGSPRCLGMFSFGLGFLLMMAMDVAL